MNLKIYNSDKLRKRRDSLLRSFSKSNIEKLRNDFRYISYRKILNEFIENLEFTIEYYFSSEKDKSKLDNEYGNTNRIYSLYNSLIFNELLLTIISNFEKQEFYSEEYQFENQHEKLKLPFLIKEILKAFYNLSIEDLWQFDENPPFNETEL